MKIPESHPERVCGSGVELRTALEQCILGNPNVSGLRTFLKNFALHPALHTPSPINKVYYCFSGAAEK